MYVSLALNGNIQNKVATQVVSFLKFFPVYVLDKFFMKKEDDKRLG